MIDSVKRLVFVFVFLFVAQANAETHERVSVTDWVEKGDVVGVKVKLTLRPTSFTQVRVGLGDQAQQSLAGMKNSDNTWREAAAGVKGNYIVHSFGEVKGVTARTPKEVEFSVRYANAPNLKPGQPIEVVTAWKKGTYWHIHGAQSPLFNQKVTYNLPKASSRLGKVVPPKAKPKTPTTRTSVRSAAAKPPKPKAKPKRR